MDEKSLVSSFIIKSIRSTQGASCPDIEIKNSLTSIGIDSLVLMDLIFRIEAEFGIEFSDQDLLPSNLATVASLIHVTERLVLTRGRAP